MRKILFILILFSIPFWHFSTYAANINKEISQARNYYMGHKYQKAINILENIRGKEISKGKKLRVNNLLSKAYIKYAYAELKNNRIDLDDFISLNKKAYNIDPSQTEAVYNIAVSYCKKNQVEEGIKWMEKAYPNIVNKKNERLLSAIKVDPDLIHLRSYPKFNEKFPELASHDVGGVKYSLIRCGSLGSRSYRSVRVDVPKEVDLSNDSVAKSILEEAAHYAQKKCPKKEPFSNISVNICYPGERINMASVHGRNYDSNKLNWREYRNKPLQKRLWQERQEKKRQFEASLVEIYKGVKFSIGEKRGIPWPILQIFRIIGEVPSNIDLADGGIAKDLLRKGFQFARSKCPKCHELIVVVLFEGKFKEWERFAVRGVFNQKGEFTTSWYGKAYINKPEELAEEKREKLLAQKRLKQFEKKYGVTDWPAMKDFSVNPFIYEGKNVAFVSEFGTMLSATEGIFKCGGEFEFFIVSDIPKGFFTKEAEVVIVGRPLGKKGTRLPLFGEVLVPNLKFIGAYFCEKQHCRDIVWE